MLASACDACVGFVEFCSMFTALKVVPNVRICSVSLTLPLSPCSVHYLNVTRLYVIALQLSQVPRRLRREERVQT